MRIALLALLVLAGCTQQAQQPAVPQPKAFGSAIVEVSGGKQIAAIGTALEQPLVVQVNDAKGVAVAGALVTFHVGGTGHAEPSSGLTGADGQFTTTVSLGGSSGGYSIVASTRDSTGKAAELKLDAIALGYQQITGRQIADLYCARCHNPESTPERVSNHDNLAHPAHAFGEGAVLNAMSDADLTSIIAHGGPALNRSPEMPPYGYTLNRSDIAAVIAYIRAVADPPFAAKGAVYAKN